MVRSLPLAERHRGVGLQSVAEHVESAARGDHLRKRAAVVGVDNAHGRPESAVSEAGLGLHLQKVEYGDAGGLGAGAGSGRDGDVRLERSGHRSPLPYGSIDVREEVGGVRRVEVGGLGGVDAGAASDGDERVEIALRGEVDGGLERLVGRLDFDLVEQDGVDALDLSESSTTATGSSFAIRGSVTTATRLAPSRATSYPTSRVTPGPNLMAEVSMEKAVSRLWWGMVILPPTAGRGVQPRPHVRTFGRMCKPVPRPLAWRQRGSSGPESRRFPADNRLQPQARRRCFR